MYLNGMLWSRGTICKKRYMNLATSEIFIEQSGSEQHEATCFSISLAVVIVVVIVDVVDDDVD